MLDEFEEFEDILENVGQRNQLVHLPRRYIRDAENPLERFEDSEFKKRYRFDKDTVTETLLPLVIEALEKPTNRGLPIPPVLQLLVALRFYATSSFQVVSGDLRGISQPTVSRVIKKVSILIAERLGDFVKFPNTVQGFRMNTTRFYEVDHFPNVSGCIDCTHIKISNPGGDNAEIFRNRKGFFFFKCSGMCCVYYSFHIMTN